MRNQCPLLERIDEWKQKLRELWKHSIVLKGGLLLAVPKKAFEELLKDEKEAKP